MLRKSSWSVCCPAYLITCSNTTCTIKKVVCPSWHCMWWNGRSMTGGSWPHHWVGRSIHHTALQLCICIIMEVIYTSKINAGVFFIIDILVAVTCQLTQQLSSHHGQFIDNEIVNTCQRLLNVVWRNHLRLECSKVSAGCSCPRWKQPLQLEL